MRTLLWRMIAPRTIRLSACAAVLLLGSATCRAQDIIASSGNHFQNATTSITFTIGEVVITTHAVGGVVITQGFHQPPEDFSTAAYGPASSAPGILAFPNPARDQFTVQLVGDARATHLELFDALGRMVRSIPAATTTTVVDVNDLAAGSYVLRAWNNTSPIASIQLTLTR